MSNATASIDISTVNLYYKDWLLSIKKNYNEKKLHETGISCSFSKSFAYNYRNYSGWNLSVDFTRSLALFTRIFDYFDRENTIVSPENGKKPDVDNKKKSKSN